jgi:hypothetical protein
MEVSLRSALKDVLKIIERIATASAKGDFAPFITAEV